MDRMIRKYGQQAILRRAGGDRTCWVFADTFRPNQLSDLIMRTDTQGYVSPVGLDVEPDKEQDRLVLLNQSTLAEVGVMDLVSEPTRIAPHGEVVLWILHLRESRLG